MTTAIVIPPGEIHIWFADLDSALPCPEWLSPEEQQRCSRMVSPAGQRRCLASRTILRSLAARYLDVHPAHVQLASTRQGKLFIPDCGMRFNLSHSHGAGLFGFSCESEIGIDIERIDASHCTEEVARLIFTSGEFTLWMALESAERTAVFFRVWTRKEAILKATGEGLGRAMDTFAVPWTPEPAEAGGVWLHPLAAPDGFEAALAVIAPRPPIVTTRQLTMPLDPRGGVC